LSRNNPHPYTQPTDFTRRTPATFRLKPIPEFALDRLRDLRRRAPSTWASTDEYLVLVKPYILDGDPLRLDVVEAITDLMNRQLRPGEEVSVNTQDGTIYVPGSGRLPLIGPTNSNQELDRLKKSEASFKQVKVHMQRQLRSKYQCIQCKRKWSGKLVRIKWVKQDGVNMETLVCPDTHCDSPVVMVEDALSLTHPPGGKI
jgi:hypothetical protein